MTHPMLTWLEAQLAADEKVAQAALEAWRRSVRRRGAQWPKRTDITDEDAALLAFHHAHHDPAAVLADIASKRAIIELHGAYDYEGAVYPEAYTYCGTCGPGDHWSTSEAADAAVDDSSKHPCRTIRILASAYAHRDGYLEEWKPT